MKKNKMLRIASVLLIVTILSTVAISGTFAKYITKYDGGDTARVANFGITVTETGDLFKTTYTDPTDSKITVASASGDKVVAPGTSSAEEYQVNIAGTPEVTTKLSIKLTGSSDIVLPAGTYEDYTTADDTTDTFTLANDYEPIKFNIKCYGHIGNTEIGTAANPWTFLQDISLTDFAAALNAGLVPTNSFGSYAVALEGEYLTFEIPAGKNLDVTFIGGWTWDFENLPYGVNISATGPEAAPLFVNQADALTIVDKADTYLGYNSQTLNYTFEAAAVQVD